MVCPTQSHLANFRPHISHMFITHTRCEGGCCFFVSIYKIGSHCIALAVWNLLPGCHLTEFLLLSASSVLGLVVCAMTSTIPMFNSQVSKVGFLTTQTSGVDTTTEVPCPESLVHT